MTKDEALKMAIEILERIDMWLRIRDLGGLMPQELKAIEGFKEALEQSACPECGGNGAGGEHEEDCSRLQLAQEAGEENYHEDDGCPKELVVLQRFWRKHQQPAQKPLTQEKYEQLKNQSTKWTSSLPMFVHLINKHFGIDDGLDWGQK